MIPAGKETLLILSFLLHNVFGINEGNKEARPSLPPDLGGEEYPEGSPAVPSTNFDCRGRREGHYGDKDFGCVVFHYCSKIGKKYSYKCKEGKKFDEASASCAYFVGTECASTPNNTMGLRERSREREAKLSFPSFQSNSRKREADETLIPNEGLGALAAFASLAHAGNINKFTAFQNSQLEERNPLSTQSTNNESRPNDYQSQHRSFSNVNHESKYNFVPVHQQSRNSAKQGLVENQNLDPNQGTEDTEYYEDPDSDLNEAPNRIPYQPGSYSHFPPPAHVRDAFHNVRDTVNSPTFTFANSRQVPQSNVHELRNLPVSHVHFTPPGSRTSQHLSISPHRNTGGIGSVPTFHSSSGAIRPKPPTSVFNSPTPRSFDGSTTLKDVFRTGYETDQSSTPHYFDYYSGYQPLSTPVYYDDVNYDAPAYFNNPSSYKPPVNHQNSQIVRNQPLTKNIGPQIPLTSALRGQQPHSYINHPNYIHSNIKNNNFVHNEKTTLLRSDFDNPKTTFQGTNFVSHSPPQSNFVTKNPIIHVTSKIKHPVKYVEPTYDYQDSVIDKPNQNYQTTEPPTYEEYDDIAPITPNSKFMHDVGVDITTYSPKYLPKTIENIVELDEKQEHEKIRKPIEDTTSLPAIARRRPGRRPVPSAKIRTSTAVEKFEPSQDPVEDKETYEEHLEDEAPIEKPVNTEIDDPITKFPSTTLRPKPTSPTSPPSGPILKGSLKERLNRLGTRRRTQSQSNQRQAPARGTGTTEPQDTPKPTRTTPLKRPGSRNEAVAEKVEGISLATEKELKGRITNYFKDGSSSRNKNLARRPQRRRNQQAVAIEDKKEEPQEEDENFPVEEKMQVENAPDQPSSLSSSIDVGVKDGSEPVDNLNVKQSDEPSEVGTSNGNEPTDVDSPPDEAVSEAYDDIEVNEGQTTSESPKGKGAGKKRTMNPDVRARFKEFLKNRRNGSNNRKRLRPQEGKETTEPDNAVANKKEKRLRRKSIKDENNETDNTVNESEIFEESVPLFREEKIIRLPDVSETTERNEIYVAEKVINNDSENRGSLISSKPLRYELSKQDKADIQATEVLDIAKPIRRNRDRDERPNDPKYTRRQFPAKLTHLAPPSITSHTVVRPDFKQIVKMSPRQPGLLIRQPPTSSDNEKSSPKDEESNKEIESKKENAFNDEENNEKQNLSRVGESSPESIKISEIPSIEYQAGDEVHPTEQLTDRPHELKDVEKPFTDTFPHSYENLESVGKTENKFGSKQSLKIIPTASNPIDLEEHREKTKPIFNLDAIDNSRKDAHISATGSKLFSDKKSPVNFEPFPLASESQFLPIELLLQVT